MRNGLPRFAAVAAFIFGLAAYAAFAGEAVLDEPDVQQQQSRENDYAPYLNPQNYFTAKNRNLHIPFSGRTSTNIQGSRVVFMKPKDITVELKNLTGADGNTINFVYFQKDGEMLVECSFRQRDLEADKADDYRRQILDTLFENHDLRELESVRGEDPAVPVIELAENSARIVLLKARHPSFDADETTVPSLYEGFVLLKGSGSQPLIVPVAAQAHRNSQGIDAASVYVTWLHRLVEDN